MEINPLPSKLWVSKMILQAKLCSPSCSLLLPQPTLAFLQLLNFGDFGCYVWKGGGNDINITCHTS